MNNLKINKGKSIKEKYKSFYSNIKLFSMVYIASISILILILTVAKLEGLIAGFSILKGMVFSSLILITNIIIFIFVKIIKNGKKYESRKTV